MLPLRLFACIAFAALCACGMGAARPTAVPPGGGVPAARLQTRDSAASASNAIQHIVVIIQENHSVDNLFQGFPNADTASTGQMRMPGVSPTTVPLQKIPLALTCDIDHAHLSWAGDYDDGAMDGFNIPSSSPVNCSPHATPYPANYAYSYVDPSDIQPYWAMARDYTLMDNVFEDPTSPSFESHQHLIAGQSDDTSENPKIGEVVQKIWGCDSPPGTLVQLYDGKGDKPGFFPCFAAPYATVADLLDAKGLRWKYYAPPIGSTGGIWSAFDAVASIRYGPDWANVISPETTVLSQIQTLPTVTYVVPSFPNSDHAGSNSDTGPDWVASVVNAIGTSSKWKSTAIFVLWDDWGGWYDHVAPTVNAADTLGGFRVPVICISPYSENPNPASPVVDHTRHGTDGILTTIEQTFGLGNLGQQDAVESPYSDCFDFKQKPKPFVPIPLARYNRDYFLHQAPSDQVPDNE